MSRSYPEFPELSCVYLEDSYVLSITETGDSISLSLDVVLTPNHPHYRDPEPGDQHCYARAQLVFSDVAEVHWLDRSTVVCTDATGETDLGSIDAMIYTDGHFYLEGDWGRVQIHTQAPPRLKTA